MPTLYGTSSNPAVSQGNSTGLYGGLITPIPSNAESLLMVLSNNGSVDFALDPAYGNARVRADVGNSGVASGTYGTTIMVPQITVGADGRITAVAEVAVTQNTYSNADVASYLPVYSGNIGTGAGYLFGNGSQLTGLPDTYSNANVASYLPVYSGNIGTGAGYLFGNGSQLTGLPATYSNADVKVYLESAVNGIGTAYLGGLNVGDGLSVVGNISTTQEISSAGNITSGASITAGAVSVTGDVLVGDNIGFVGAGTMPAGEHRIGSGEDLRIYAGANKTLWISNPSIGMSNIHMRAANITIGSTIGNTAVDITGTLDVSNNITAGAVSVTGDLTATGNINATGGDSIFLEANNTVQIGTYGPGNGIQITGPGIFGVANLTGTIATFTGNVAANAVLTDSYLFANGTPIPMTSTYSNATVASYLPVYSGNVGTGDGYIFGNGSGLTNITGANVTGTVANAAYAVSAGSASTAATAGTATSVTGAAQSNITSVGNSLTVGNINIDSATGIISSTYHTIIIEPADAGSTGNVIIEGNLRVTGNVYSVDSQIVTINDKDLVLANNQSTTLGIDNAGLWLGLNAGAPVVEWIYDYASNRWTTGIGADFAGTVIADYFQGNGSQITGISYSQISGLGTAATTDANAYATAAQGLVADSAVQPLDNISVLTNDSGYITTANLSGYATESYVTTYVGDYVTWTNVSGKPTFATVATTGAYSDLTGTPVLANVATTGAYSDLTGTPVLANVATTGDYTDLINKPTIPTLTSQLTNDSGFITNNQTITVSGDASGTGTTAITLTLANTAVTAGSYGSSTLIPVITVDSKGRLTAVTTAAAAGGSSGFNPFLLAGM